VRLGEEALGRRSIPNGLDLCQEHLLHLFSLSHRHRI
jgi:hypothetical protein